MDNKSIDDFFNSLSEDELKERWEKYNKYSEGGEGENNAEMISLHEVRELFANYRFSEGCSCCRNIDKYEEYSDKIGELLKVEKYSDDSGYNFSKHRTP